MADLQTLQNAFMKADAAGDTASAQVLATAIKSQMATPQSYLLVFFTFVASRTGKLIVAAGSLDTFD